MLIDVTKPEVIKFLVENYEKVAHHRLKWNNLYKEKLVQSAEFTKEEKGYYEKDPVEKSLEYGMHALSLDNMNAAIHRKTRLPEPYVPRLADIKTEHNIVNTGLGDPEDDPRLARSVNDMSYDPVMRPVPKKQRDMIYKDLPEFGRMKYLKTRNLTKPEDKYYFQESSGWTTGWRLKDSYFGKNAPKYPRQGLLQKCLVSRIAAQPDPPHYKNSKALFENNVC